MAGIFVADSCKAGNLNILVAFVDSSWLWSYILKVLDADRAVLCTWYDQDAFFEADRGDFWILVRSVPHYSPACMSIDCVDEAGFCADYQEILIGKTVDLLRVHLFSPFFNAHGASSYIALWTRWLISHVENLLRFKLL